MQGWLAKRGPLYGWVWQPRWCVLLSGGVLEYYADEARTDKKGAIELYPSSCAVPFAAPQPAGDSARHTRERPFGFVLDVDRDAGADRRLFYFDAGGPEALQAWRDAVAKAAAEAAARLKEVAASLGLPEQETPSAAAERLLSRQLGGLPGAPGRPLQIGVLGGLATLGAEARMLLEAVMQELCASLGGGASFVTCGAPALQKAVAASCGNGARLWNLVPMGQSSGSSEGVDVYAGTSYGQCKQVLALLGDVYLAVEGSNEVTRQLQAVQARGAAVVPFLRACGPDAGSVPLPRAASKRPGWAAEAQWATLSDRAASARSFAAAVAALVAAAAAVAKGDKAAVPPRAAPALEITNGNASSSACVFEGHRYKLETLQLDGKVDIFNIDLHNTTDEGHNVGTYYELCRDRVGLHVTTSCFSVWKQSKRSNKHAKVIPAVATAGSKDRVRIFFFDDNLEMEGGPEHCGICNLRDVDTGKFVEFGEGQNGFKRELVGEHTVIHHSADYVNVLVRANILDAMADPEYFADIVRRYAAPSEKVIVFMDVNSTIVCNDTVIGKDTAASILSTMCMFVDFTPTEPFDLEWDCHPPVRIEKARSMKHIAQDLLSGASPETQSAFWREATCTRLFEDLAAKGKLHWSGRDGQMTSEDFRHAFSRYIEASSTVTNKDGITTSWFRVFEELKGAHHTVVLNSFGVDTRKVVLATVPDERNVQQVAVNFEVWDARDVTKFANQFEQA